MSKFKFEAIGDNIILKIFHKQKKTNSGIILPDHKQMQGSKLKDNVQFKPIAEVVSVGEKVKTLKKGDKILLTKPHFMILRLAEIWGEETGEEVGYDYTKAKEEDILGIIKWRDKSY